MPVFASSKFSRSTGLTVECETKRTPRPVMDLSVSVDKDKSEKSLQNFRVVLWHRRPEGEGQPEAVAPWNLKMMTSYAVPMENTLKLIG